MGFILVGNAGTGPNDAHLSPQHIDDLWKLIQARGPPEPATWNQAIVDRVEFCHRHIRAYQVREVSLMSRRGRVYLHGPKLVEVEAISQIANALLAKEHRTGSEKPGHVPRQRHRGKDRKGQDTESDIHRPLPSGQRATDRSGAVRTHFSDTAVN